MKKIKKVIFLKYYEFKNTILFMKQIMNHVFTSLLLMKINEMEIKNSFILIFLCLLFWENRFLNFVKHKIESLWTHQFKYSISLYGYKQFDKFGYNDEKFIVTATPGFISVNNFLMEQLENDNLTNLNDIDEILIQKEKIGSHLQFQMKCNSLVQVKNDKLYQDVYFTTKETKLQKNEKNHEHNVDDIVKSELCIMSNKVHTRDLMKICKRLSMEYDDMKQGKTMNKILIANYKGVGKNSITAEYDVTNFESNTTMDNLFFEEKEKILKHVNFFKNNKNWYVKKGRPYTLGICTWGPPGCGKTSFEKALAIYLNRHLIMVDFDKIKNQQQLHEIFYSEYIGSYKIPWNKRLYVFPDIDRTNEILYKDEYKKNYGEILEKSNDILFYKKMVLDGDLQKKDYQNEFRNELNLSQILNTIDGIMERSEQIFIMSANHPEKLDPAMLRPGRIDCSVHFKEFNIQLLERYIYNFYNDSISIHNFLQEHVDELNYKFVPSKLFEICVEAGQNQKLLQELLLK